MAWTTPRTWVSGETVTAALLNVHVKDNLNAIGGAWTSYIVTTTGITLGSGGTVVGAYMQAGKLVSGRVLITLGTSGALSGTATVSLPANPLITTDGFPLGTMLLKDFSTGATRSGIIRWINSTSNALFQYSIGTADAVAAATTPWTWAASDTLLASFSYEAA